MKFLFAPIGIVTGLLAGIAAQKAFERIWAVIDDEDPPEPGDRDIPILKLIGRTRARGGDLPARKRLRRSRRPLRLRLAHRAWPGDKSDG